MKCKYNNKIQLWDFGKMNVNKLGLWDKIIYSRFEKHITNLKIKIKQINSTGNLGKQNNNNIPN
jgi:hypothetical protein